MTANKRGNFTLVMFFHFMKWYPRFFFPWFLSK